ncbi:TIGR03016 family PEP-CTERM system-associated outer membrane protein [Halorhodospira halophila]|uniref:TIGR03016 family PEP-CTERM system-associated outer membrane protein n=1 Tax=Halorhodospira TaxID=85108 RepID=UPI001EE7D7C6|nr:TIGR03016 family PEP-CTERM system-associated outer membrane protein [Halorhodospira halophila]MCG5544424.1 TIGR03016 family PEP-CTERM system-associated outer membrane protein [Halorhodospira sp. 9628]
MTSSGALQPDPAAVSLRGARPRSRTLAGGIVAGLLLVSDGASASTEWTFTPRMTVGQEWTDNAGFAPRGAEESDFITLLRPSFTLSGEGARAQLDLSYSWDNRFYWDDSDRDRSTHNLSGRGNAELVSESIFVDGSIRRSVRAESVFDPVTPRDQQETTRYRVSPYWVWRVGRFADQEVRYVFDEARYHRSDRQPQQVHRAQYRLDSGPQFGRTFWQLSSERTWDRFDDPERAKVDRFFNEATLGYQVTPSLRTSVSGGDGWNRVEDQPQVDTQSWRVNADWGITRNTQLQGSYGQFKDEIDERDQTNRREQRSLTLTHQAPRSTWRLSYSEARADGLGRSIDEIGVLTFDDSPPGSVGFEIVDRETDREQISFTEVWRGSWDYSTGPNTFRLEVSRRKTDRDFDLVSTVDADDIDDDVFEEDSVDRDWGVTGSWTWAFGARTQANLRGTARRLEGATEQIERGGDTTEQERETDEWRVSLGLSRSIGRRTSGDLDFSHRQSRQQVDEDSERRRENRISARLTMEF